MELDTGHMREPSAWVNECSNRVIGAAIAVHRQLGPGFLESTYEAALALELEAREIAFERQHVIVVRYNGVPIAEQRIDLLVEEVLVVELKSLAELSSVHIAQTRAYLAAAQLELGLLINFNVPYLRDGIKRVVWSR
ncbi:MAG: GxxExxY protein [Kofleriaceae bacterium]